MLFEDRVEAGRELAERLKSYRGTDAIVLGLPRGGVIVAGEVARALDLPFDVFVVRKIGAPGNPEFGIGAIAENGEVVLDEPTIRMLGVTNEYLERAIAAERQEIERRVAAYRGGRPLPDLHGRTVIVVDDGIATGHTMFAAIAGIRAAGAKQIVAAVPVGPPETIATLRKVADDVIAVAEPEPFYAVGYWYVDFHQVTDDEVRRELERVQQRKRGAA